MKVQYKLARRNFYAWTISKEDHEKFYGKKKILMPCPTCGLKYWHEPDYVMPKQCSPGCGEKEIREATRR